MSDDRGTNAVLALVQSLGMFAQICGDVLASMHSVFLFIVLLRLCSLALFDTMLSCWVPFLSHLFFFQRRPWPTKSPTSNPTGRSGISMQRSVAFLRPCVLCKRGF